MAQQRIEAGTSVEDKRTFLSSEMCEELDNSAAILTASPPISDLINDSFVAGAAMNTDVNDWRGVD